jgi:hypothetical protein
MRVEGALMFFSRYELRPQPAHEDFDRVGGAVAGCFLDAESAEEAQRWAYEHFQETHWEIVSVEIPPNRVEREDFENDSDDMAWFDQAQLDGECYVFFQWPAEAQEGDVIH